MKIIKGMLLYHKLRQKWCIVLKGGTGDTIQVNFNNRKVVSEPVDRSNLCKGYEEVRV